MFIACTTYYPNFLSIVTKNSWVLKHEPLLKATFLLSYRLRKDRGNAYISKQVGNMDMIHKYWKGTNFLLDTWPLSVFANSTNTTPQATQIPREEHQANIHANGAWRRLNTTLASSRGVTVVRQTQERGAFLLTSSTS